MESKSFIQTLKSKSKRFAHATTLEDVLCLTVLVDSGLLSGDSNVDEARQKWLEVFNGNCDECPRCNQCVACIINE